ncbi:ribose 5-phosphate isomerase B [Candidatus Woesearchaeota archaeon]|nr:ribose 5-phosphate isomerase B [Candidatus Woesearchaeota archaeon]
MTWKDKKVMIGSDHAGFDLKIQVIEYLKEKNIDYEDMGTYSKDSCNYSEIGLDLAEKVVKDDVRGILICGTGLGMSIAANKVKGARATLCYSDFSATMSRRHNDSNVLCLGARTTEPGIVMLLVKIWLDTEFDGDRHQQRIDIIHDYEEKHKK